MRTTNSDKTLVDKVLSFFTHLAVTGAIAALGCVPAGQAEYSNWPVPKQYEREEKKYDRHIDDETALSPHSNIYRILGFESSHVASSYKIGNQPVVRLKRNCGNKNHGPSCITRSFYGLENENAAVLVTLKDRRLYFVLEGDNTSFLEIFYDPDNIFNNKENRPKLILDMYAVGPNGKVINPVPKSGRERSYRLLSWQDIIDINNFLLRNFKNSIFTEDDVFEAEYFLNPTTQMRNLITRINNINTERYVEIKGDWQRKKLPLLERVKELVDYSRIYRKVSERSKEHAVVERAEVKLKLVDVYSELMKEGKNQEDISNALQTVKNYLNLND